VTAALPSESRLPNALEIQGRLVEMDALRHTPAGIAVLKFRLEHQSTQMEAGVERKVACEIDGVAFDREARLLAAATLGQELKLRGFVDSKSAKSRRLVLHATRIEFTGAPLPNRDS